MSRYGMTMGKNALHRPLRFHSHYVLLLLLLIDGLHKFLPVDAAPMYPPNSSVNDQTLQSIVVVHRHGARLAAVYDPSTEGLNWSNCPLTDTGVVQLRKLGSTVRAEYAAFLPRDYDPPEIQSCFTEFTRTQRSGLAFLAGLFPSALGLVSMLCPMELERSLRPWERFPAYVLHESHLAHSILAIMNEYADANIRSDLRQALDAHLSSGTLCSNKETMGLCMMLVFETVSRLRSEAADCPPALCNVDIWPYVDHSMKLWNYHYLLRFPDEAFQKAYVPSLGGPLSTFIIDFMKDDAERGVKVRHLSAHDDTLIILYQTLGLVDASSEAFDDMMQPSYGEALLFESHKGGYFVVRRAQLPEPTTQNPDPYYRITTLTPTMCQSPVCRFIDWATNIEQRHKLPYPNDFCMASPDDHEREGCTHHPGTAPAKPRYPCIAYRKYCPQYACAPNTVHSGYVLDHSKSPPVCIAVTTSSPSASSTTRINQATSTTTVAPPSSRSGEVALMVCLILSFSLFFFWFTYALLRHYRIITITHDDGSEYRSASNFLA